MTVLNNDQLRWHGILAKLMMPDVDEKTLDQVGLQVVEAILSQRAGGLLNRDALIAYAKAHVVPEPIMPVKLHVAGLRLSMDCETNMMEPEISAMEPEASVIDILLDEMDGDFPVR